MADEKRTEVISFKVGERMALDILRLASLDDRSISEYVYLAMRQRLYGDIVHTDQAAGQSTKGD